MCSFPSASANSAWLSRNICENFSAWEVEEVPVLLLLHDAHQPETGELDVEVVRFLARLEAGRFEMIRADGPASHISEMPTACSSGRSATSSPSSNFTSPAIGTLSGPTTIAPTGVNEVTLLPWR
jgi:hypothetical protein